MMATRNEKKSFIICLTVLRRPRVRRTERRRKDTIIAVAVALYTVVLVRNTRRIAVKTERVQQRAACEVDVNVNDRPACQRQQPETEATVTGLMQGRSLAVPLRLYRRRRRIVIVSTARPYYIRFVLAISMLLSRIPTGASLKFNYSENAGLNACAERPEAGRS